MMTDLDRLKSAVNIADLVNAKYPLLNGNNRYRKTQAHDSLVVDSQNQTYFWNSKGEQGDLIDWVGRHELGYNSQWDSSDKELFKQALKWLAKYAGLPEPEFKPEAPAARAQRLTNERTMALAADYYQVNLNKNIQGYNYATEIRGFTPEIIQKSRLGYSSGCLHQAIPEPDRSTAADLGLLVKKGQQYYDAIPRDYLVYIHHCKSQVEYFSGRAIAEKQHLNQRSPKKMFWAAWNGYSRPVVIVEGPADAISIAQLGANGLALCGINLADFDPDMLKLFTAIYIWVDNDPAGQESIKTLIAALSTLVRIISLPEVKDANDYLLTGVASTDFDDLLQQAKPWLDIEIDRLAALDGLNRYNELEPLFCHLVNLSPFDLTHYRSKIRNDLDIKDADFNRYLKAAKGTLSDDEESEFSKGGQYCVYDGWTVLKTFTDEGKTKIMPLANGAAQIVEEILCDDGSNDPELDFLIVGELANGQKLPKIQIPAEEYARMGWPHRWGSRFILSAGRSTQDHFRAAVQFLSGTPYRRTIYTHTGWRRIDGQWQFLSGSGALGSGNDKLQVDLKMGRPDTHMTRYILPTTPEDIAQAMQISLNSWHITDLSITVPLWAAMYLSPLLPFLTPDFGLWMHGATGSMKSSMVAVFLAHFGQWQGTDAKIFLPSNFQSTANNILMCAFQAKDVPLVIDDFAPGATQKEVRERDNTASNLLRSIGNKAARGRMRDGRHFQADFPPRCLTIITAEDLPKTQSIMARGIGISVSIPPKGDPARRPIEERLKQAQTVDSYFYPHAMAGFILWVQRHWDELARDLPQIAGSYRDKIQTCGHARLPDAFGKLMAAIDIALYFAMDCGAITQSQAEQRKKAAFEALGLMMTEHGEAVDAVDSTRIFQEILTEQLDAREWWLCAADAPNANPPLDYPPGCHLVGFYDDSYVYLLSKTVNDIMQLYMRLGTPFPVGRNTLLKRLMEKGWLIPGQAKTSDTVYIQVLGTSPRVLKLVKSEVLPS